MDSHFFAEQLWCLNPKKILENFPPLKDVRGGTSAELQNPPSPRRRDTSSESTDGRLDHSDA